MSNKQYLISLINSYNENKNGINLNKYKVIKRENILFNQRGITNFFLLFFITFLIETTFISISLFIY